MRFLPFVAFGALALALSTIGCSADATDDGAAAAESDVTVVTEVIANESDEGTTVQVKEGDTFSIKLKANPTTGYEWKVTKTDRTFAYPYSDEFAGAEPGGPIGAGGTQYLKWSTEGVSDAHGTPIIRKLGKHYLTLEYRRPFEPATTPAVKTYKITVEVVAKDEPVDPNEGLCNGQVCGEGSSCQFCWGAPACVPNGALC